MMVKEEEGDILFDSFPSSGYFWNSSDPVNLFLARNFIVIYLS